ncbi:MAG: hypothetical protein EA398_07190 [Deltaproteobacteria bacterium]|nr:MAG: hypothetical protein EA398_07190 [Deltaproteobacteria bacterium]
MGQLREVHAELESSVFGGDAGEALAGLRRLGDALLRLMERLPAARPRLAGVLTSTVESIVLAGVEGSVPAADRAGELATWLAGNAFGALEGFESRLADILDPDTREALVEECVRRSVEADILPEGRGPCRAWWSGLVHVLRAESDSVEDWISAADAAGAMGVERRVWEALILASSGESARSLAGVRALSVSALQDGEEEWSRRVEVLEDDVLRILGRDHEAFERVIASWRSAQDEVHVRRMRRLLRHPDRGSAVDRAAARLAAGGSVQERVVLQAARGDAVRLAEEVQRISDSDLEGLPPEVLGEAATMLREVAPLEAGRIFLRLGMIDGAEMSLGAQNRAMVSFEAARECFDRAGSFWVWKEALTRLLQRYENNTVFGPVFRARFTGPARGRRSAVERGPKASSSVEGSGGGEAPGPGTMVPPRPSGGARPSRSSGSAPAVFVRGSSVRRSGESERPVAPAIPESMSRRPPVPPSPVAAQGIEPEAFSERPQSSVTRRALRRDASGNPLVIRRRVEPVADEDVDPDS